MRAIDQIVGRNLASTLFLDSTIKFETFDKHYKRFIGESDECSPVPANLSRASLTVESINPFILPYKGLISKGILPDFKCQIKQSPLVQELAHLLAQEDDSDAECVKNKKVPPGPRRAIIEAKTVDFDSITKSKNPFGTSAIMSPIIFTIIHEAIIRQGRYMDPEKSGDDSWDKDLKGFTPWNSIVSKIKHSQFYKTVTKKNLLLYPLLQIVFDRHYLASDQARKVYSTFELDLGTYIKATENSVILWQNIISARRNAEEREIYEAQLNRQNEERRALECVSADEAESFLEPHPFTPVLSKPLLKQRKALPKTTTRYKVLHCASKVDSEIKTIVCVVAIITLLALGFTYIKFSKIN